MVVKLMILSCGTNASYHVCKHIKENFFEDFYLIGTDTNDSWLVPSISFIDSFYKVPKSEDGDFVNSICEIFDKERPDFILPSFDFDQKLFYNGSDILKKFNVKSLSTSERTLKIYENKLSMNSFLINNGLPTPVIFNFNECDNESEYFVKPCRGVGSIGARILTGKEIKCIDKDSIIIQEICKKPEVTMECFHYGTFFTSICRERIDTKSGVCTKARIFQDDELFEIGKKFSSLLDVPYLFNLQFMKNTENHWVITDVNLRTAGGMSMSCAVGWDAVSALAKIMLGKTQAEICNSFSPIPEDCFVVRSYQDIVNFKKKKVVAFDLDGTILDSRKRHEVLLQKLVSKHYGFLDTSDLISFKREGFSNIDYLLLKKIPEDVAKEIQKEWIELIETDEYLEMDTLYSDSLSILNKYSQDNDLILLTARKDSQRVFDQLKKFKIDKYFKEVCIVYPDNNVVEKKCMYLRKYCAQIMVGDTKVDYCAARSAGIEFIYRGDGFHSIRTIMGD